MNLTESNSNTAHILGAMNSLFYAGGFFGSIVNSWYVDRYGQKTSIATVCIIMIISAALCAGLVDVAMFIVFRFFSGWSRLMLLVSVPLWITEVAPPKGRGFLANIHALMATLVNGMAAWVGVGFFFSQNGSGNQWRAPLAFACLAPLVTLIITYFAPESPRYLLIRHQPEKALELLQILHHNSKDVGNEYAQAEFMQMKRQHDMDSSMDSSWRILINRPSYKRHVLIACALLTLIYSSGTLTVSNSGPTLFTGLGYKAPQTLYFRGGIILVSALSLVISLFVVDLMPRNVTLGAGMIAVAVPLSLEAAMTATYLGTSDKDGLGAGVAFLFLYIFVYGIFLDGPGYFYANEIFPTHLRAKGATCCIASYSLINIMWTQVSPIAFASIGWKYYLVFIVCCLVGGTIMFLTFPDTRNKPLEEIARMFGDVNLVAIYSDSVPVNSTEVKSAMGKSSLNECV
ncbi:hypothetical protein LTR10_020894 [Elasticomyces elasticus]|uniref:Major facilitator superfamily (MFS) profile domain-containing protein n=1 Tax=Exophiala sideris TaxID=1016849 RepID=A0ABR0IZL4_9EURO|nr:hypothetical protein LTR10_020894 [Elasticomyces elasticus]KAK5023393.1 hypothetical protein LTS07_009268 [Exophiala sideris]KAK5028231.1 hypothetical protein LTR13_009219 [Exophiala sideris]KAK5052889.1 hypothetical protein LTR69_009715 [Exophiala sideris]KAK5178500.1 hypothetical protein LTR44_009125 [Eurotiomycetes sp. CCFEE 6388]